MIGDKRYTEALEDVPVRRNGLVGERSERIEVPPEGWMERPEVRMQT